MRIPRKVALLGAAVFVFALPASNAVGATATDKKQNTRIQKLSKDLTALKKAGLTAAQTVSRHTSQIADLDTRLKTIEGAAPQIIKGLSDLGDAAKALKTGLETAGAGLTSLKTLVTSTEYGVAQVFIGATPLSGAFLVTPDIPDAVQQAQTSGSFLATGAGTIHVQVAVRSAETDGANTTTDPAASCRVTVIGSGGSTTTSKPNAALGGAPFWGLAKSAQTSTDPANAAFPFGPKTTGADADNLVDLTDISGGGNAIAPGGGGTEAASAGAGSRIDVQLSCVDTTPSTTDPGA